MDYCASLHQVCRHKLENASASDVHSKHLVNGFGGRGFSRDIRMLNKRGL